MNVDKVIETLKDEAKRNKAYRDVFQSWSQRERARDQVTVRTLYYQLKDDGKENDREEYARLLGLLSKLGLGNVKYDKKGDVIALVDVQATLQSIGQAVMGKGKTLEAFTRRAPIGRFAPAQQSYSEPAPAPRAAASTRPVSITIPIGGRMVDVPIPDGLSSEELGEFIRKLLGK